MKKLTGSLAVFSLLFLIASCGGVSEDELIGKWTMDPTSVDIELGDGISMEKRATISFYQAALMSRNEEDFSMGSIEFKKGGKVVVSDGQMEQKGSWTLNGGDLTIGMNISGLKVDMTLQVEKDGEDLIATLQATELIRSIKKVMKQDEEAKEMVDGLTGDDDLDQMADGTSISVKFKKK